MLSLCERVARCAVEAAGECVGRFLMGDCVEVFGGDALLY